MSERGSFVTQYIYCKDCFAAMKKILVDDYEKNKFFCATAVPHYSDSEGQFLPIIAGKIGGNGGLSMADEFAEEFPGQIEAAICHSVRIAFFDDTATGDAETVEYHPITR